MRNRMMLLTAAILVCLAANLAAHPLAAFTAASTEESPEGHWEGTLQADGQDIGLSLDLSKNEKLEWIGSMGIPSQNISGLVVMDIKVDGNALRFVALELRIAKVALTLMPEGILKGTISNPRGDPVPIEFRRTGMAKVELIASSPAVSKELEGDWDGSLQTPGRSVPIILHFKNRPDNTVAATIDTPESGSMGAPLNDVKQDGLKVQFGLKIAHGRFLGMLNETGNQLSGELIHEQTRMQLSLKKK